MKVISDRKLISFLFVIVSPQTEHLAALVGKVVDEFAVLPIFPSQRLFQLEHLSTVREQFVVSM